MTIPFIDLKLKDNWLVAIDGVWDTLSTGMGDYWLIIVGGAFVFMVVSFLFVKAQGDD